MEAESWRRYSAVAKHHRQRLGDPFLGFEELDGGEEEARVEYFSCPFCMEEFDIIGLCCHMDDEHPVEARSGICPFCAERVGLDLVGHITLQHGGILKLPRRRLRRGLPGSQSSLELLRKDLRDGKLRSFLGGSSEAVAHFSSTPDPLLTSFVSTLSPANMSKDQHELLDDKDVESHSVEEEAAESDVSSLPEEEKEERARRSEFVQGLVLSTIFDD